MSDFPNEISQIKNLERRVGLNNPNKCERFRKRWVIIENKIRFIEILLK